MPLRGAGLAGKFPGLGGERPHQRAQGLHDLQEQQHAEIDRRDDENARPQSKLTNL